MALRAHSTSKKLGYDLPKPNKSDYELFIKTTKQLWFEEWWRFLFRQNSG
jgi:hypothetical protein